MTLMFDTALPVKLLSAATDAVGRLRTAEPHFVFNSTSAYNAEPQLWETVSSGAGATAAHNATTRAVDMTLTAVTGSIARQTYSYIPYQTARSQAIYQTCVPGAAVTNVTKRWGQFDSKNGLFWQQAGTGVLSVVERYNETDTAVAQSAWNLDKLDGTGPSGVTLDVTKDNLYVIDYVWLGIGTVRYGVYLNGQIVYCHQSHHSNLLTRSFMQSAFLPMRYEMVSSANATATLTQICTAVASEGGTFDHPGLTFGAARTIANAISTATEVPLIAIRPATTFNSLPNRSWTRLDHYHVYTAGNVLYKLYWFPPGSSDPTSGGSWAAFDTNSSTEVNVSATGFTATGGIVIDSGFVAAGNSRESVQASIGIGYPFSLNAAGTGPAYMVVTGLGAGATASGVIDIMEIR